MKPASLIYCKDYQPDKLRETIARHFELAGGLDKLISRSDRVILKPNLIAPHPPERPSQTHPAFIVETAKLLKDFGARVCVADSPAWSNAEHCLEVLGAAGQLREIGVEIKTFGSSVKTRLPYAEIDVNISKDALEADAIINLPKLKAHQQLGATIAFKNMFGTVCGKRKAYWHFKRGKTCEDFAALILGIYEKTAPVFNLIDGIVCMEGRGPLNGNARNLGITLSGSSALSCELACARLLDYRIEELPLVKYYLEQNPDFKGKQSYIIGDNPELVAGCGFQKAQTIPISFSFARIVRSVFKQLLVMIKIKAKR
ncbi:hypothetical protein L21SP3_00870 [Sedimentisphaera cyanobacteriorum]|uniref:DUF362 domain-containing protein n=1 Tax=Sedimentisphaera cyanobacteriorum TaxID=1940790 RepID=A0A1Q2HNP9_9BACT|nr:DUF362 domain-containing protein [Sedimentisphaera cyanobacteriorum]AQQ09072.1 hypothetical protein L21SP3_00870 [Sedimentisphaera cyanobacteriorum]